MHQQGSLRLEGSPLVPVSVGQELPLAGPLQAEESLEVGLLQELPEAEEQPLQELELVPGLELA